jgi:hypothetical protein
VATIRTASTSRTTDRSARSSARRAAAVRVKIVRFVPRRLLERATRTRAEDGPGGCVKCGSFFLEIEPAFVHCRYCGSLSRIRGASLLAQEEYELRSGLRLAS